MSQGTLRNKFNDRFSILPEGYISNTPQTPESPITAYLEGDSSSFYSPSYTPDTFTERKEKDTIETSEWNKLGDALYRIEQAIQNLTNQERLVRINPEVRLWAGTFSPVWDLAGANQLSATGKIILPESACQILGTNAPIYTNTMVKVSCRVSMASGDRYGYVSNMTSAYWCPVDSRAITTITDDIYTAGQDRTAEDSDLSFSSPEIYRTVIVGLYFKGFPVPTNLNLWGIVCSVLVACPG